VKVRASIRLLTAIALIGICGIAITQGSRIVHFSLVTMNIDSSERRAELINTWGAVPGVASKALRVGLTDEVNPSDTMVAYRRREILSEILSIKPLSSMDWLSLSAMRLATDQSTEDVLASLKLSMLTGPNEAYIMVKRGLFGVSLWESLSPDFKSRVAYDLAPTLFPRTPAEGAESGKLQALLAAKPAPVRQEIREALLATGLSPKEIERTLGF
jgi:hypothetical protein